MNDHLIELMQQCREPFEREVDLEKFVHLIVQECADICEEYRGTGWDEAAERIAERIKERFGVE